MRNTSAVLITIGLAGWMIFRLEQGAWCSSGTQSEQARVPLFEGLGKHGRKVTTSSTDAQKYFDQGLAFLYAFNHDEAIRSFQQATEFDATCAMAWWGISLANGPHINNPVVTQERAQQAWSALEKARQHSATATAPEKALIEALGERYANPQPDDRRPLDEAYASAMRTVWKAYPADADIGSLFVESLMDLRPWDLWTPDGKPQPGTDDVVTTLETILKKTPNHALAIHLYIHAVEASPTPERADEPADRLRQLQPGLGHLVHMPSHIDVRRGRWAKAIEANELAIEADRKYRQRAPKQDFYHVYMAHNHHMLAFAAMMRGQSRLAIQTIHEMAQGIPADWVKQNAAMVDGFTAMPLEVLVRFGRWDEVLAAPEPPDYLPLARTLRHCARGIALAALGKVDQAVAEQAAFRGARQRVPADAVFGNNTASDLLAIAEPLLAGEILYRQGKVDSGIEQLREAVKKEDALRYAEPPDWIHPIRHALGASLLNENRAAEAEAVYREDLVRLPENGWGLFGLARSLKVQGKMEESQTVETRLRKAWADADIQITSSCFCLPGR
jgi:tetratricopeptide (TPR) repeat protein